MKLTKEQRSFIERKIRNITQEAINKKHKKQVYIGDIKPSEEYPSKVNKAIEVLMQYQKTCGEEYKNFTQPIYKKQDETLEKLLFMENYEQIQDLLKDFKTCIGE